MFEFRRQLLPRIVMSGIEKALGRLGLRSGNLMVEMLTFAQRKDRGSIREYVERVFAGKITDDKDFGKQLTMRKRPPGAPPPPAVR